jgi:hypothetical protein
MKRLWLRFTIAFIALLMLGDFIFRGILTAPQTVRNDFSEPYVGAWMWRHGENFYDSALTKATATRLTGSQVNLVLIYPPTALVLISPFSFLPWTWANTIWQVLGLGAVAATILMILRLGGLRPDDDRAWVLATFLLAFSPLHQAFHMANVALFEVPLCLLGVLLAERGRDLTAGIVLGVATALKPQLGLWVLLFYLIQFRRRFALGAMLPAVALLAALIDYPVPFSTLVAGYRHNLHYWFAPGHLLGYTEGAMPFHVNTIQVILYQLVHRVALTGFLAHGIFVCGLAMWLLAVIVSRFAIPFPLAISSLLGLSFISLYHSVSDVTLLTLALCWAYGEKRDAMRWSKRATCFIFLLLMLPGHSLLIRTEPRLGAWLTESWWWRLLVARYFVWLLLALNAVMLYGVVQSYRAARYSEGPATPDLA